MRVHNLAAWGERGGAVFLWGWVLWPLWRWLFTRMQEPFDAGSVAWIALVVFTAMSWRHAGRGAVALPVWKYVAAVSGLLAFSLTRPHLPITLCGAFGLVGGVPLLLPEGTADRPFPAPLAGLALAGLPSLLILDMFLGFPLRVVSTTAATWLLRLTGLTVVQNGMELTVNGVTSWVDAPCAGVRMLGTGIVFALVLAYLRKQTLWGTTKTCLLTVAAVCLGNILRVALLTFLTVAGLTLGTTAHALVGCFTFLPALILVTVAVPKRCPLPADRRTPSPLLVRLAASAIFAATAILCLLNPKERRADFTPATFPGWPATFDGDVLKEEPLEDDERKFAEAFPGRIARFQAGRRMVILRWTDKTTHRVHGAAYCLRATGWKIDPITVETKGDGAWSTFTARRGNETLRVREQARDASGQTFSDVPAWFFNTLFGKSPGPWWIVTVAERA